MQQRLRQSIGGCAGECGQVAAGGVLEPAGTCAEGGPVLHEAAGAERRAAGGSRQGGRLRSPARLPAPERRAGVQ